MAATMTAGTISQAEAAVARAAARPFTRRGESVVVAPIVELGVPGLDGSAVDPAMHVVVVADRRRLECIVAEPSTPGLGAVMAALVAADWDVVVLAPAAMAGDAHRALRGSGAALQLWWSDGDGVGFGRPERP